VACGNAKAEEGAARGMVHCAGGLGVVKRHQSAVCAHAQAHLGHDYLQVRRVPRAPLQSDPDLGCDIRCSSDLSSGVDLSFCMQSLSVFSVATMNPRIGLRPECDSH